jgi:hypothetical protein
MEVQGNSAGLNNGKKMTSTKRAWIIPGGEM